MIYDPCALDAKKQAVIVDAAGCWIWQLGFDRTGYGHVKREGKQYAAHRYAYLLFVGPIPEGHELDHLCRVRACVNPAHLQPVTHAENVRRGACSALKVEKAWPPHCTQGHGYDEANTYVKNGRPCCRQCVRDAMRRHRARRKRNDGRDRRIGSLSPAAKLTEDDVRAIRLSPLSGVRLAAQYGVSTPVIYGIRNGTKWKRVA